MKKLLLALAISTIAFSGIEIRATDYNKKSSNRISDSIKMLAAATVSGALAYLAYTSPVEYIGGKLTSGVDKIKPYIDIKSDKFKSYLPSVSDNQKKTIFTMLATVASWDLAKYAAKKWAKISQANKSTRK